MHRFTILPLVFATAVLLPGSNLNAKHVDASVAITAVGEGNFPTSFTGESASRAKAMVVSHIISVNAAFLDSAKIERSALLTSQSTSPSHWTQIFAGCALLLFGALRRVAGL